MDDVRRILEAEKADQAREEAAVKKAQDQAAAQRQAELEAAEAAVQAGIEERRTQADAQLKERVRLAFMHHPAATEADFEKAWPELRQQALAEETFQRDAQACDSQATIYRNTW